MRGDVRADAGGVRPPVLAQVRGEALPVRGAAGGNPIDTFNFGQKELGQVLGQNLYSTLLRSLDMFHNSKHDLGQVLGR